MDFIAEGVVEAIEMAIAKCADPAAHEKVDAYLKKWRDNFEYLIAKNSAELGILKGKRRRNDK